VFFLLFALPLAAQEYTTTGNSTNWEDPAAWNCSGGGCAQNPVPPNTLRNITVNVNHDLVRNSTNTLTLQRNGRLNVNNSSLVIVSRLWLRDRRARLVASEAEIIIGEGVDLGGMDPSSDLFNIFWNSGTTQLNEACFTLLQGNLYNFFGTLSGTGGVRALDGRLRNIFGNWSRDLVYFGSNGASGVPGSQSSLEEVNAACERCKAGDAAPVLDAGAPTSFCAEDLIPALSSYINGTAPEGAVLTWSTNADPLVVSDHLNQTDVDAPNPGTYYGFFFDAENSCASPTVTLELIRNSAITVEVNNEEIIEGETVTLTANATGGNGNYSYLWSTGETTQSIDVSPDSTTEYTVTVSDDFAEPTATACSGSGNATVTVNPIITVTVNSESINQGESVTLTANATGGNGNYSYLWSNGEITQSIVVSPAETAAFSVTVNDDFVSSTGSPSNGAGTGNITVNPTIVVEVGGDPDSGGSAEVNNVEICEGDSATLTAQVTAGGTGPFFYQWKNADTGANIEGATGSTLTVSPNVTTNFLVTVTDSFTPTEGPAASVEATGTVTVNPPATASVGDDQTICETETVTVTGVFGGGASSGTWSTSGTGTFDDTTAATAVYTPSDDDILAGTVTLTYTTDDPDGPCVAASDDMVVAINEDATADAGADQAICETDTVTVTGVFGGGASNGTWSSSGTGTFDDATAATAVYTPSDDDILAGTVTLTYTTDDPAGPCAAASDDMVVTINEDATADAGADQTICETDTVTVIGVFGGGASSGIWSTSGTGTFDDATAVTAVYTPSDDDILAGTVTLTYTTDDPAGPCVAASDDMVVTINPEATADAGADIAIYEGETVSLAGSFDGGASSGSWTTTGDGTFDDRGLANAEYTPGPNDITDKTVTLTFTTDDPEGPCDAASDDLIVTINPEITVTLNISYPAGNEGDFLCRNEGQQVTLTAQPSGGNGVYNYLWSTGETTQTINVNPSADTEYTVEVTDTFTTTSGIIPGVTESTTVIVENCDLREATIDQILVHEGKLSNALAILAENGYDPNNPYNEFLYTIRIQDGVPKVLVQIVVASGRFSNLLAQLASFGIQQSDFLKDYDTNNPEAYVSCFVPLEPIQNLRDLDVSPNLVQVLDGRLGLTNTGSVLSEGVAAMRANIARLGWEVTGDGITIGVISDSFDNNNGYGSDQLGENLPGPSNPNPDQKTPVDVLEDLDEGGSDEGRAMLQLIHDVAPDANLKFATGFNGKYNAASQIEALRLAGCDIIVDDVQYIDEAFYEDDVWAQAVNDAVDAGVMVFTAAGNFGSKSIEQTFTPAASNPNFHDWGGDNTGQTLTLDPGFYIISVQWDDDYISLGEGTGAKVDLNAYLGESPDILDFGSNVINFNKDPMDFLYFLVLNPTTTNLLVERGEGSATTEIKFKYVVFRSGDLGTFEATPPLDASTVVGHANAEKNFSVGAVRYDRVDPTPIAQQSSSLGGTLTDGVVRQGVTAMGPTGGDTTVPIGPDFDGDGQPNFFGTSAAAPHVAAVAAMLQEAGTKFGVPLTGANSVRDLLLNTAVDMGDPQKNGAGFVRADLALGSIANPVPNLISLNFEQWLADNPGFVPGETAFTAFYEGQNFTPESVVFFQGQELPTTFVDSETLSVTIPEFEGNGDGFVFTPPGPITNGSDGGESETVGFFDIPAKNVIIRPADITRFYGTSVNPTDNPELFSFTVVDAETGDPLPQAELDLFFDQTLFPVTYSTTDAVDSPTSVTFSVILNVDLDNVNPGILELYNFDTDGSDDNGEIQAGNLFIEPTHVEISVEYPETLVYGEAFPGIDYVFNYVDDDGNPVPVAQSEKDKYELAHRNAFRLVNSVVVIANGRFRLVNDGTTNRFRLVNCEDPDPEVNRFRLVNGQCEPEIVFDDTLPDGTANRFRLVNQTFYVSQSVVSESSPLANRFRLVNGDGSDQPWDADTKIIEIDPDLFANANRFRLVNGRNITNLFRLVNDNEYDFFQDDGTTNRFRLVNGVEFSQGSAFFDGELINRFRLVNGRSFRLVNDGTTNRFRLVNSDTSQPDPFAADTENSVVLFNSSEGSEVVDSDPIEVFPVNFITGKDVGIQYVGTGRVLNNNFVATSTPVPVEILPAPLEVAIEDLTREYGTIPPQEEFSVDLTSLEPQLQYDDTLEDVFPEGLNFELDCEQCDVAGSPHLITASSTSDSGNYDIAVTSGVFNVEPFALTHTMDPATITRGEEGPFTFDYTLSTEDPAWTEADLPFGETRTDIFGPLTFDPADGCDLPESGQVSVNPKPETSNYSVTYVDGPLTVLNPTLQVIVSGTNYIQRRDFASTDFEVSFEGLVCDDPAPEIEDFVVLNSSGDQVSGRLDSGVYQVLANVEGIPGLEQYEVEQQAGELFVNPRVSCRNRIRAKGPCRSPASLPDDPRITTKLTYTYENRLDVPIFIPRGQDNYLFGPAYTVGELPEVFLPGVHTFEIFTDGKGVKWGVESPDCWFPDITIWATVAPSCSTSLTSKVEEVDSFTREFEDGVPEAYPNPATDYLTLFVGNMEGSVNVTVFDEAGRLVMSREYPVKDGQSEVYMDISALKEGVLTIMTENQGNRSAFRIIKQ